MTRMMKAAVVTAAGKAPMYVDFPEPTSAAGQCIVQVAASALSHIARSRAAGAHYSSAGAFPFVAGIDGVGTREDGGRVYFIMPTAPYGAMAERCIVDTAHCIALPADIDATVAAAAAIPGMSSWAALTHRAKLVAGESVLINGVTGTSGRLAVQIAKRLGAGRVIATGRNAEALESLRTVGADDVVLLTGSERALEQSLLTHFSHGIDVVLDYLWGPSAQVAMFAAAKAGAESVPIRFVQIGAASSSTITLQSAALRSSALVLMGSGIGSIPFKHLLQSIQQVLACVAVNDLSTAVDAIPLRDVAKAWAIEKPQGRIVFAG